MPLTKYGGLSFLECFHKCYESSPSSIFAYGTFGAGQHCNAKDKCNCLCYDNDLCTTHLFPDSKSFQFKPGICSIYLFADSEPFRFKRRIWSILLFSYLVRYIYLQIPRYFSSNQVFSLFDSFIWNFQSIRLGVGHLQPSSRGVVEFKITWQTFWTPLTEPENSFWPPSHERSKFFDPP